MKVSMIGEKKYWGKYWKLLEKNVFLSKNTVFSFKNVRKTNFNKTMKNLIKRKKRIVGLLQYT